MAITGRLVVTPEQLESQAAEVRRLGTLVKNDYQAMKDLMEKTRSYWIGDAGDLHRKLYDNQKDDIDVMIRRILEHPTDLEMMAGIYKEMEINATSISSGLPGDII